MDTLTIIEIAIWIGLVIVNGQIAPKKGCDMSAMVALSCIAAPLVYLYLLALPPKS